MLDVVNDKSNYIIKNNDGHTIISGYDNDTKIINNKDMRLLECHFDSTISLLTGMKLGLVKFYDMIISQCALCQRQSIMGKITMNKNLNTRICNECFNICQSNIIITKERMIKMMDVKHEYTYYAIITFDTHNLFMLDHCQYFNTDTMNLEYTYDSYHFTYINDINQVKNLTPETLQEYLRRLYKNKYVLLSRYNDIKDVNMMILQFMINII